MVLAAVSSAAVRHPHVCFDVALVEQPSSSDFPSNVRFSLADCPVDSSDSPFDVLRHKRNSTLGVALSKLASGEAKGCITAANTGALVSLSRHFLSRLDGVKKLALVKPLPTGSYLLDLGASIDCSADDLIQFAFMGSAYYQARESKKPTVALLNVGSESHKGTKNVRQAHEFLMAQSIDYVGFIEADDLFKNKAQVIVCDGFVGNIALKSSEGLAQYLKRTFQSAVDVSENLQRQINPGQYNGACLLGVSGTVVKSHGGVQSDSYEVAIEHLLELIKTNALERFSRGWLTSSFFKK